MQKAVNSNLSLRGLALVMIRFYQRFISPYKGFRCAYCAFTGNASCSALGYRAIRRFGAVRGVQVLRGRLVKCGVAYRRYSVPTTTLLNREAGFCDCDPGGCDLPGSCDGPDGGKSCLNKLHCLECADCGWGSEKKKRTRAQDPDVHVPPPRY
jgi:putative component of membrane protein insertase Oxa1/YidC/SpoIIIJ protein YidD